MHTRVAVRQMHFIHESYFDDPALRRKGIDPGVVSYVCSEVFDVDFQLLEKTPLGAVSLVWMEIEVSIGHHLFSLMYRGTWILRRVMTANSLIEHFGNSTVTWASSFSTMHGPPVAVNMSAGLMREDGTWARRREESVHTWPGSNYRLN